MVRREGTAFRGWLTKGGKKEKVMGDGEERKGQQEEESYVVECFGKETET